MNALRILFIVEDFRSSSEEAVANFIFQEAKMLGKIGAEIHVATYGSKNKAGIVEGIQIHNLDHMPQERRLLAKLYLKALWLCWPSIVTHPRSFIRPLQLASKASQLARSHEIEIIHAHFAHPEGLIGALTRKLTGKPLVVTVRGVDILVEPSVNYRVRLNKNYDIIVKRVLRLADKIIAISRFMESEAAKLIPLNQTSKLRFVHNGVDISFYKTEVESGLARKQLRLPPRARVILTVRRQAPKMGLEYLIKAFFALRKENENVFLVLVGPDRGSRHELEALARELGIQENVIFTGEVPRSQLPYYYADCDVFVLPSLIEGFPNACLEAMASARPVVATSVDGLPELIEHEVNGLLVKPKDAEDIAEKVSLLLDDSDMRFTLGMNARQTVEKSYTLEDKIRRIFEVYAEILKKR